MRRIPPVVDWMAVDYESNASLGIKTPPELSRCQCRRGSNPTPQPSTRCGDRDRFDLLVEFVRDKETELEISMNERIHKSVIAQVKNMARFDMCENSSWSSATRPFCMRRRSYAF